MITIAKEANIPAEIYHLKTSRKPNWHLLDTVITRVERARAEGLQITADIWVETINTTFSSNVSIRIYNYNTNTVLPGTTVTQTSPVFTNTPTFRFPITTTETISWQDLVEDHEYGVEVMMDGDNLGILGRGSDVEEDNVSKFKVTQSPVEGDVAIPIADLWKSGSNLGWDYTLFTEDEKLVGYFTSNNIKQKDIPDSGFFNITIPWSIIPGDEFRFEGREDRVFLVKDAYVSGSKLIVDVDQPIPNQDIPSPLLNLDEFLIRRYVDEAGAIVIQGSKPQGSSGPYIIKPEYLSEEMDKDVDIYIRDLTEKGLI